MASKKEEWREVGGYEGYYEVSDTARIKAVARSIVCKDGKVKNLKEKILQPTPNCRSGYLTVCLHQEGRAKRVYAHRLVGVAFVEGQFMHGRDQINHKDGDKQNNLPNNLEWVTELENRRHAREVLGKHTAATNSNCSKELEPLDVNTIFQRRNEGLTYREIGELLGVSASTVFDVCTGNIWREYAQREGLKVTHVSRVTTEIRERIRTRRQSGDTLAKIAEDSGFSISTIRRALNHGN